VLIYFAQQRHAFYIILLYDCTKAYVLRRDLVWIGGRQYARAVKYIQR